MPACLAVGTGPQHAALQMYRQWLLAVVFYHAHAALKKERNVVTNRFRRFSPDDKDLVVARVTPSIHYTMGGVRITYGPNPAPWSFPCPNEEALLLRLPTS
jgi:succinate dehydrogenase/fumarate reductase flavoprotein subunit